MKCIIASVLSLATLASGQLIQVTSDPAQDINPSAGNDITYGGWVVWQTNRNGNWDVYGCRPWPGWLDTVSRPVCTDSADDLHPVLAPGPCADGAWCVWERREGPLVSTIWAAHDTSYSGQPGWSPARQIGRVVNATGDSAFPSVFAHGDHFGWVPWVVWSGLDTSGSAIYFTFYESEGDSWRTPAIAYSSQDLVHHPRIGRGMASMWEGYPLLVWEENGDILLSRFLDSTWTAPESVAPSAAYDCEPEVASFSGYGYPPGPFIVWQSRRDGDTAVYVSGEDSFSVGYRLCDSAPVGANYSCVGGATTSLPIFDVPMTAWVSNRSGNSDIYTTDWPGGSDHFVDNDTHADLHPTVSSVASTGPNWAWFFWQSDRTANWDIWCVVIEGPGVEETPSADVRATAGWPTILSGASGVQRLASCVVIDAMGRRVTNPKPGIYFVRDAQAQTQAQAVWKVVVAE